jgi:hypothetical protein
MTRLFEQKSSAQIYNNIIYGMINFGIYVVSPIGPVIIKDNIFAKINTAAIYMSRTSSYLVIYHNMFDVNRGKIGTNYIIGNPLFVNPAAGDFHLQAGSPACGMGAFPCADMTSSAPSPLVSINVRVAKGRNDVEESSTGKVYFSSTDLELVYNGGAQKVGIRFVGVNIPQGATIVNAYIQFKVGKASTDSTTLAIRGDARANALAFTNTARNVSSRPKTRKVVNWSPPSWPKVGAAGSAQATPNLAPIIQEIVSQPGWVSGNSMVIIVTGRGKRVAKAYEGNAAGAPLLHVDYTTDTVVSNIPTPLAMAVVVSTPTTATPVSTITSVAGFNITENTTAVPPITSTDAALPAQTLSYSISGGADAALFGINSSTGELIFLTAPDFEAPMDAGGDNIYNVTVRASDGELTSTQDITVTVTAVNDNNPVFTSNSSISIAENSTAVTTVTATDADLPAQALTYSIIGGVDAVLFNINPSTGELSFVTGPDCEILTDAGVDNIYNVTVRASDGALATTQDIAVIVKDSDQPQ